MSGTMRDASKKTSAVESNSNDQSLENLADRQRNKDTRLQTSVEKLKGKIHNSPEYIKGPEEREGINKSLFL